MDDIFHLLFHFNSSLTVQAIIKHKFSIIFENQRIRTLHKLAKQFLVVFSNFHSQL